MHRKLKVNKENTFERSLCKCNRSNYGI